MVRPTRLAWLGALVACVTLAVMASAVQAASNGELEPASEAMHFSAPSALTELGASKPAAKKYNGKKAAGGKKGPVPYTNVLQFPSQKKTTAPKTTTPPKSVKAPAPKTTQPKTTAPKTTQPKTTSGKQAPVPATKKGNTSSGPAVGSGGKIPCYDAAQKNRIKCTPSSDTSSLGPNPYNLGANAVCVCTQPNPTNIQAAHRDRGPKLVRQLLAYTPSLGLTAEKAVAIVANMFIESPGILSNRNEERDACRNAGWKRKTNSRCGFGWVQWTNERRTAYFNWCADNRVTPGTDRSNFGYLVYEFNNPYTFVNDRGQTATDGLVRQTFRQFVAGSGGFSTCRNLTCWANKWRDIYERPSAESTRRHPNERAEAAAQLWGWYEADRRANVRTTLF